MRDSGAFGLNTLDSQPIATISPRTMSIRHRTLTEWIGLLSRSSFQIEESPHVRILS
jgi:hypothetical protein